MGTIVRTEGARALFKGLAPALVGTAPFAALNFTTYQLLQTHLCDRGARQALARPASRPWLLTAGPHNHGSRMPWECGSRQLCLLVCM